MEPQPEEYARDAFHRTAAGDVISRQAVLKGADSIYLAGHIVLEAGCVIRGDLAAVRIGRYCRIGRNTVVRPPHKRARGGGVYAVPVAIGDHVTIEDDCVVEAAAIGSAVVVERGATLGARCILKDACLIAAGAVVAPETVVPPFCVFAGTPAVCADRELPESWPRATRTHAVRRYDALVPAENGD